MLRSSSLLALVLALPAVAVAQPKPNSGGIMWYATLESGLAEAKRTDRPILFLSAAPHCGGVSGMWWPGKQEMDRSFLSSAKVIEASRQFVCVRLTTYEDETEAKFSQRLVRTRSGEVENTSFALFEPDGKTTLSKSGRGMRGIYNSADDMAKAMADIAKKFPGKAKDNEVPTKLPYTLTAKLGVNVAAADHLPLIVILAESDKARTSMAEAVAKPAWGKTYLGHFTYAEAKKADDLPKLAALKSMDSIVFIEPDRFGQTGTVIEQLKPDSTQEEIEKAMNTLLKKHTVTTLTERAFREAAVKAGAFWEPKLTVSDPQEQRAREETKRRIEMMKK